MCYTPEMSFTFAILGIIGIVYLQDSKKRYISYVVFFYVLMELLQTVQYHLVNDCENWWNKTLTEVAYIFVIVQPLVWNAYFYSNSKPIEQGLFKSGIGLSIGWLVFNVIGRLLYGIQGIPTQESGAYLYASNKVCTRKASSHLFWNWTSADLGDYNATFIMHLLIWFIPALLSQSHRLTGLIILFGAALSFGVTMYMGDLRGFTAAWCYISIPILAAVFGISH